MASILLTLPVKGQYTLDEIGFNLGGGYGSYLNNVTPLHGPAARLSGFYSHYFCGKAFGIQAQAGVQGLFPSSSQGPLLFPVTPEGSNLSLRRIQAELGFFFKLRPHDYHRRKEWALIVGPVLPLPISTTFTFDGPTSTRSGNWDLLEPIKAAPFPLVHLSFQLRRPLDKKSWFIQPGVEFSPAVVFETAATSFRSFNAFITFGYAFWEKRG